MALRGERRREESWLVQVGDHRGGVEDVSSIPWSALPSHVAMISVRQMMAREVHSLSSAEQR